MAKPNYSFEKRQKDLARKKKQEEKRQRKAERQAAGSEPKDNPEQPLPSEGDTAPQGS